MNWASLVTSAKVATVALVVAAVGQLLGTAILWGFSMAAGIVILVFLGLAALAATGRWWALAVVGALSALLTVLAIGQATERIDEGEVGELIGVLGFLALTLTAAIAGIAAAIGSYRTKHGNRTAARG